MQPDNLTLKQLFKKDVRYIIPMFQRPYVWNQEDQWEPLWDDVRNVAERYLDVWRSNDRNGALAEQQTKAHFMGAIVIQQQWTSAKDLEAREVIDGQQRLTTMQLLLDAAQEVFEELGADVEASSLSKLVRNSDQKGDTVFKIWPTSLDQDPFRAAMTNGVEPAGFEDSLIVQAHDFFRLQIREWVESGATPEVREERIHGLETALFGLLYLVVIDLAADDDAFVIFETLNARGTPLLNSDLIKNYILQSAKAEGGDDEVHASYWKHFEDAWWRAEVQQGRLVRPRIDVYLNYWVVMATAHEVQTQDVFKEFKKLVESGSRGIVEVAGDLQHCARVYREFDTFLPTSTEGTFMYRWRTVDAGASTPVVLWLFAQPASMLTAEQRNECLAVLESFLVRRLLCRMTTKAYNQIFLELLGRAKSAGPGEVPDAFRSFLAASQADSRVWPSGHDVVGAVLDLPLYRLLTRGRLRFVLEAIEESMRDEFVEESAVQRGTLSIEHVLPQSWVTHWPLEGEVTVERQLARERLLHTMGNLTLVNPKLNLKLSNDSWEEKRRLIERNSVMHMNKALLAHAADGWSDSAIRERGNALATRILGIWPGPPPAAEQAES
jgi:hypothetical protein